MFDAIEYAAFIAALELAKQPLTDTAENDTLGGETE